MIQGNKVFFRVLESSNVCTPYRGFSVKKLERFTSVANIIHQCQCKRIFTYAPSISSSVKYESFKYLVRNYNVNTSQTNMLSTIQIDEQLKQAALSQVNVNSRLSNEIVEDIPPISKQSPPKKSLIQGKGIEGATNLERLKNNTRWKLNADNRETLSSRSLWVAPTFKSDMIVVLDMDECLIHSQFLGYKDEQTNQWPSTHSSSSTDNYRQYEADRPYSSSSSADEFDHRDLVDTNCCESFKVTLPDGDLVRVNKRPHLSSFLEEVCNNFETYIFTAAVSVYASPVLDRLDPNLNMLQGRFYRESCTHHTDLGVFVKNLSTILENRNQKLKELSKGENERIVLIDNNPLSFLANPSNGILVSNFYDDPMDDTLPAVLDLLQELDKSQQDVRPQLDNLFGLKDVLNEFIDNK